MALTLLEISGPAERLAFIERVLERQRAGSARLSVVRRTPRVAALTASAAPVSAPVARPKAVKVLSLADLTDGERRRIELAFHEAGHSVAAVALGGVIRSAVVASGGFIGTQGLTTVEEMPLGDYAAQVAYSGPWAQARWRAGRRPGHREIWAALSTGGDGDYRVLSAAGGTSAGAGVVPLLDRCWPSIVKVAQKLLRDNEVRHDDVCRALGLSDAGGPGSHELALIRSGQAPGTFTVTRAAV